MDWGKCLICQVCFLKISVLHLEVPQNDEFFSFCLYCFNDDIVGFQKFREGRYCSSDIQKKVIDQPGFPQLLEPPRISSIFIFLLESPRISSENLQINDFLLESPRFYFSKCISQDLIFLMILL